MLTLEKFKQASAIVKEVTLPTKLVYSEYLSKQTGADVYLKPENMQYTGAYKVRGTGRGICSKEIRLQGNGSYADSYTIDQSKSYKELWSRSRITRRCL